MNRLKHDLPLRLVKALNVVLLTLPFVLAWMMYYSGRIYSKPFYSKGNYLVLALFLVLYCLFGRIYDAFFVSHHRVSEMVYSQSLAALVSDGIMYIIIWLLMRRLPNPLPLCLCLMIQVFLSVIWSYYAHRWYFRTFPPKRTAIVYDMRDGMERLISEYGMTSKFDVVVNCSADECIATDLAPIREEGIEVVYLCGVHSHERNIILKYCVAEDITTYVIPRVGDVIMSGAKKMHMFHLPMLRVDRYHPDLEFLVIKRAFDILVSGAALLLLSPFMLITAIAIKTDGGPVLYKQTRLTKNGREFKILKFRSMRVDAEKDGVARLSSGENDDRITKVGKVIRKIRFDELPQLFNILKGDMSIVGPRPERPEIAAQYEEELPEFSLRLQAKAGLTGFAQVYGKYNTSPYDKLQMDLTYIAQPSIWQDLQICFATVKILFMPESTEGVAEGQTTAMDYENAAESTENDAETVANRII